MRQRHQKAATAQSRRPNRRGGPEHGRCPPLAEPDQSAFQRRFWYRQNGDFVLLHGIHPAVIDSAFASRDEARYQSSVCRQGLTLARAPFDCQDKSADGNFLHGLIRLSGSLAFLSSSFKTNKYFFRKSTAVVASRGAPTCYVQDTQPKFHSLILFNEFFNHFSLAYCRFCGDKGACLLNTTSAAMRILCPEPKHRVFIGVALGVFKDLYF